MIKRYDVPDLLLNDESILKNVMGCDINLKEGRSFTYMEFKKKKRSKSGRRSGHIITLNKRERTNSFFHFFM